MFKFVKSLLRLGAPTPTAYVYMPDLPTDPAPNINRLLLSQSLSGSTNTSISISLGQIKTLFANATIVSKQIDPTGVPTATDATSLYVNTLSKTIWLADLTASPAVWKAQTSTAIGDTNPTPTQLGQFYFNTTDNSFWINASGSWIMIASGSPIANVLYKVETNYGGTAVLANSGGNVVLGGGGVGQRQLEANAFSVYQLPIIDANPTPASTIISAIVAFAGATPVYITATGANILTRLTRSSGTYVSTNPASLFGGGTIQSISYSGSGAVFWVVTATQNSFKLSKVQANADGSLTILAITGTAFLITGASTSSLASITEFAVSTDISANGMVAYVGFGVGGSSDGNYIYYNLFTITGSNITITANPAPFKPVATSQLLDVVSATIITDETDELGIDEPAVSTVYFYACTTSGIYRIDPAYTVSQLPVVFSGQLESVYIYSNNLLFATRDNLLHSFNLNTNTQFILDLPPNFVFSSVGIYASWYDGTNFFYYAEGSSNGGQVKKYIFSFNSISGVKTLQAFIIGAQVYDNTTTPQGVNQVLGSDANARVVWKTLPQKSIYSLISLPASGQTFLTANVGNIQNDIPNSLYNGSVILQPGTYTVTVSGGFEYGSSNAISDFFIGFGTEVNGTLTLGRNVIADGLVNNTQFAQPDTQNATAKGFIQIIVETVFYFWYYRNNLMTVFDGGFVEIVKEK